MHQYALFKKLGTLAPQKILQPRFEIFLMIPPVMNVLSPAYHVFRSIIRFQGRHSKFVEYEADKTKGNARTTVLLVVAAENDLDIELVETNPDFQLKEYLSLNPLGLIPTFRSPDGWVLTEAIAIALHFTKQKETSLLGRNDREYIEVIRWMSFVNSEVQPNLANWFKPLVGRRAYVAENVRTARERTNRAVAIIEAQLRSDYLTGDTLTLADLFAASSLSRGFQYVFDGEWQGVHPNVTKWFKLVTALPIWRRVIPDPMIVEKAIEYRGLSAV